MTPNDLEYGKVKVIHICSITTPEYQISLCFALLLAMSNIFCNVIILLMLNSDRFQFKKKFKIPKNNFYMDCQKEQL